ncbi:hypothetical protein Tco_0208715 [Tanacetum coccineum]
MHKAHDGQSHAFVEKFMGTVHFGNDQYSLKYRYIVQSYRGRTQSLVMEKTDISENRASRNFDLMITNDASFLNVQMTFDRSRSSLGLHGNDVCSHQFRPRSSSNDF